MILVASGGMYSERLDVAGLAMPEGYDGVKMYARAKRAQVTLAREWARRLLDRPVAVNAMHPGWCDTPGIRDALPRFSRVIGPLLRTAPEGIDTTAWLGGRARGGRAARAGSCSTGGPAPRTRCRGRGVPTRSSRPSASGGGAPQTTGAPPI